MKKRRGKGTPHPRKIKALRDLTNQQVDDEPEDVGERFQVEKESGSSSESPWVRLSSVHGRVAAVCAKVCWEPLLPKLATYTSISPVN